MLRNLLVLSAALLLAGTALATTFGATTADTPTGAIHGLVFEDRNGDGSRNDDEPGLGGIEVQFANGDEILAITTAEDGAFAQAVGMGLWRVSISLPEGYQLLDEDTREIQVSEEALETSLTVGLRPAPEEPLTTEEEVPSVETSAEADVLPESGAAVPTFVVGLGAFVGLLAVGILLITLGRWAGTH